jgi:hypothetical protein
MGFLKTLWTKFLGLKTWQKVLVIVIVGSMVAGGFSGSGQSEDSSEKPTPVVTQEAQPETTLDVISKSNVKWENYAPAVKQRIADLIDAEDCQNLQTEFDTADQNNTAQRNRTGESNADLMSLIDDQMKKIGCY